LLLTATGISLPALMCWMTDGMVANMNCTRPARRSLTLRRLLGNMGRRDTLLAKHISPQMRGRADAGRTVVQLAWFAFAWQRVRSS
jgi:hypothetical protein